MKPTEQRRKRKRSVSAIGRQSMKKRENNALHMGKSKIVEKIDITGEREPLPGELEKDRHCRPVLSKLVI